VASRTVGSRDKRSYAQCRRDVLICRDVRDRADDRAAPAVAVRACSRARPVCRCAPSLVAVAGEEQTNSWRHY
jgi:hypothetical protein